MWKFLDIPSGRAERDPHDIEFFNLIDASSSLVREVVQNSIDATLDTLQPLLVRFTFGEHGEATQYINGLIPHLQASGFFPVDFDPGASIDYLTIEDYNTTGLNGFIQREQIISRGVKSNYYDFWWREGKSSKSGAQGGRCPGWCAADR